MFYFHLSLGTQGQWVLPHPSMGTLGANQTGYLPQDPASGLVKCVRVEKVAPPSLVVGQTQK